jgi:hypothetical protein
VALRGDLAGATGARAEAVRVTGHALVEMRQWTFLVGPAHRLHQRALPRFVHEPKHPAKQAEDNEPLTTITLCGWVIIT